LWFGLGDGWSSGNQIGDIQAFINSNQFNQQCSMAVCNVTVNGAALNGVEFLMRRKA